MTRAAAIAVLVATFALPAGAETLRCSDAATGEFTAEFGPGAACRIMEHEGRQGRTGRDRTCRTDAAGGWTLAVSGYGTFTLDPDGDAAASDGTCRFDYLPDLRPAEEVL